MVPQIQHTHTHVGEPALNMHKTDWKALTFDDFLDGVLLMAMELVRCGHICIFAHCDDDTGGDAAALDSGYIGQSPAGYR